MVRKQTTSLHSLLKEERITPNMYFQRDCNNSCTGGLGYVPDLSSFPGWRADVQIPTVMRKWVEEETTCTEMLHPSLERQVCVFCFSECKSGSRKKTETLKRQEKKDIYIPYINGMG